MYPSTNHTAYNFNRQPTRHPGLWFWTKLCTKYLRIKWLIGLSARAGAKNNRVEILKTDTQSSGPGMQGK